MANALPLVSWLQLAIDDWEGDSVRNCFFMALWLALIPVAHAQDVTGGAVPAAKEPNLLISKAHALAFETKAAVRDLATFRDPQWEALTVSQIAAATIDAKTSLDNFRRFPTCEEIGISRLIVGPHPDAQKYLIAGLLEISVEAVAGHYLRNHGPKQKWYWRFVWALPQGLSIYEHAHADFHNVSVR